MIKHSRFLVRACLVAAMAYSAAACQTTRVTDLSKGQTGSIAYPSSFEEFALVGELLLPEGVVGKVPAMILVHGSGGRGYREQTWGAFFRGQGIATMAIDYFGPRGVTKHSSDQPSPAVDITDALKILATHPKIDAKRIGAMGYSRGAGMTINAAGLGANMGGGHTLAAHVALYPVCQRVSIGSGGSGAPILILVGTKDSYTKPEYCQKLAKDGIEAGRDVTVKVYEGAYHGWDGDYSGTWYHAAAKVMAEFQTSPAVTRQSRADVMKFLNRILKPGS